MRIIILQCQIVIFYIYYLEKVGEFFV